MNPSKIVPKGWPLFFLLCVAVAALALGAAQDFSAEGLRAAIRTTARTSLVLFCAAYAASALARLAPSPATAWLLRNRRYLGLSFAASHAIHLALIGGLAATAPGVFASLTSPASFILGGLGYVFIAAMALTSFPGPSAALGPTGWRRLHAIGGFYLWAQFCVSFGKRIPAGAGYAAPVAVLLAVMTLRLIARVTVRTNMA